MGRKVRKYKKGCKTITVQELIEKTGLKASAAHYRLRKWEKGELKWEDLFIPSRPYSKIH